MTKRLLALILVCILAIPIMVTPAYADMTATESTWLQQIWQNSTSLPIIKEYLGDMFPSWDDIFGNIEYYTSHIKADLRSFYEDWDEWEDEVIQEFTNLGTTITDSLTSLGTTITDSLSNNTSRIKQYFLDLRTDLGERFTSVNQWITDQTTALSTKLDTLQTAVTDKLQDVQTAIAGKIDSLQTALSDRLDSIQTLLNGTQEDLEDSKHAGDRTDSQTGQLEDIGQSLETQPVIDSEHIDGWVESGNNVLIQADGLYFQLMATMINELGTVFILAFVLALSGYILYGKRM